MSRDVRKEPASIKETKADEILQSLVVRRFTQLQILRHYDKLIVTTNVVIEMSVFCWRCHRVTQAGCSAQQNTAVVHRSVR